MIDPASEARIELLTARIWKLEEALMSLVARDPEFQYRAHGADGPIVDQSVVDVLDTLPWLVGPELMGN